jgi:hypothetical protein
MPSDAGVCLLRDIENVSEITVCCRAGASATGASWGMSALELGSRQVRQEIAVNPSHPSSPYRERHSRRKQGPRARTQKGCHNLGGPDAGLPAFPTRMSAMGSRVG